MLLFIKVNQETISRNRVSQASRERERIYENTAYSYIVGGKVTDANNTDVMEKGFSERIQKEQIPLGGFKINKSFLDPVGLQVSF